MSKNKYSKLQYGVTLGLLLGMSLSGTAWAAVGADTLPTGGNVASGTASIATVAADKVMNITQSTASALINWQDFSIGSAATVNFKQNSSSATTINHVVGNNMSEIAGKMNASGNVVLINPNGVYFNGATVNVGGLGVYATNSTSQSDILKEAGQSNITIENSTINAGIGAAIANAKAWGINDYAIGIGGNANKIRLVANGDVNITGTSKLTALDSTTVTGTTVQGEEAFEMGGDSSTAAGSVIIRSDANSDDWGTVTINSNTIATKEAHVFYNPAIAGTGTTDDGVKYNIKNYSDAGTVTNAVMDTSSKTATRVSVDGTETFEKILKDTNKYNPNVTTNGSGDANARILINNVAQLQDIDRADTGNLDGKYALGKDINANSDTASYMATEDGKNYLYVVAKEGNSYGITAGNYMKIDLANSNAAPVDTGVAAKAMNSSTWNSDKGFDPIGAGDGTKNAFTGSFDGFGGDAVHGISNLTEKRSDENNVGLFGYVKGGSITRVHLTAAQITGYNNVGGIAGQMEGGSLSWSSNSGAGINGLETATTSFVKTGSTGAAQNIGGLVGYAHSGASISGSTNSATVIGRTANGVFDVINVGGIVGNLDGASVGSASNTGNVFGEEKTGGLVGNAKDANIGSSGSQYASVNRGQINGNTNTGGILGYGYGTNTKLFGVYNSNEASNLAAGSQYKINPDGTLVGGTVSITDASLKSPYGKVTGTGENTGGIAGYLENGSSIDTAYNAGNITGTNNVGGIVGHAVNNITVKSAYNGDNNTVLREELPTIPDVIKNATYTDPTTKAEYAYSDAVLPTAGTTATAYYSFYTMSGGVKTYYYYLPSNGVVKRGAGGVFAKVDSSAAGGVKYLTSTELASINMGDRFYTNRIGYKDGTVKGDENVGGIVGLMQGAQLTNVYNTSTIKGSSEDKTGALVGYADSTENKITNSFFVTGKDESTGMTFSGVTKAVNGTNVVSDNVSASGLKGFRDRNSGTTKLNSDFLNNGSTDDSTWTWITYQDQTVPMLKYFMDYMALEREFVYDGTTHNLKTDDVNNVYGRADFDGDIEGTVVNDKSNSSDLTSSTKYHYTSSSIWSPQHGYWMTPDSALTITPVEMGVDISGVRTYGEIANVKGYYICVPYKDVNDVQRYAFYDLKYDGSDNPHYTLMDENRLAEVFGSKAQTAAGLKEVAASEHKYVVTINNVVATEATKIGDASNTANKVLSKVILTKNLVDLNKNSENHLWGDKSEQQLDASTTKYAFNNANMQGLVAEYGDYNITYTGELIVNKADLLYTYNGIRDYGTVNGSTANGGSNQFTLVGVDSDSSATSVDGYLKSWDTANIVLGTGNVITNALTPTHFNMTGNVAAGNANITDNGDKAITQNTAGSYYQVMVDANGNPIGYVLTSFSALKNGTTAVLGGTNTAIDTNYNFIWKAGGDTTLTSTNKTEGGYANGTVNVAVANSTETIRPVNLTVSVNGNRDYGDTMITDKYTTSTNATAGTGTIKGEFNVNLAGLTAGDKAANVLNDAAIKTLISGVEGAYAAGATKLNDHTNASTTAYKLDGTDATYVDSKVDVTTADATSKHYNVLADKNYNYTITNGAHTETVNKKAVTITTSGEKTYGEATPTTGYTVKQSGLTDWDKDGINSATVSNSTTQQSDAGSYGTVNKGNKVLTTDLSASGLATNSNYDITYADSFVINKKDLANVDLIITGNRDYGTLINGVWTATTTEKGVDGTKNGSWNLYIKDTGNSLESWDKDIIDKIYGGTATTEEINKVFNTATVTSKLQGIEDGTNGTNKISYNTNVGTYNLSTGTEYTGSNINAAGMAFLKNYNINLNDSNQLKINQKEVTVTVNGERDYGTNLTGTGYTASGTVPGTLTNGKYNVTVAGVSTSAGDTAANILNSTNMTNVLNGLDKGEGTADGTTLGAKTNASTTAYGLGNISGLTDAILSNSNYKIKDSGNSTVKIDKAALTVSIEGQKTYGDANSTTTKLTDSTAGYDITSASGLKAWDSTTFNNAVQAVATNNQVSNSATNSTNAGTYTDKLGISGTDFATALGNYDITYATKYKVNQAALTMTTTGSKTYGDADPGSSSYDISFNGFKGSDSATNAQIATLKDYIDNKTDAATGAGTYGSTQTGGATVLDYTAHKTDVDSMLSNYKVTYADEFTINKANLTLNITGNQSYGTNGADKTSGTDYTTNPSGLKNSEQLTPSAIHVTNNVGTAIGKGTYSTIGTVGGTSTGTTGITKVTLDKNGTFDPNNYNVTWTSDYEVTPADLVITVNGNKVYGTATSTNGADYQYGFTGLFNGEKVDTTSLTINNTVEQQDGVGVYTQNMPGSSGNGLVSTHKVEGVSGSVSGTSGFDANNYNIKYNTTFEITKAPLVINTTGSKVYGEDNTGLAYTVDKTGLMSWDSAAYDGVVDGTKVVNSTGATSAAGNYSNVLSHTNSGDIATALANYDVTYTDSFDITKRGITVSQSGNKEYGTGNEHSTYNTVTVSGLNDVLSNQADSISSAFNTNNTADRTTAAGTYGTASGNAVMSLVAGNAEVLKNYDVTTTTEFTVTPGSFTYTATPTEYWYGLDIPTQSGTVANSYGEDVSDLVGTLSWNTPAHKMSDSGLYPIEGSGSNDSLGNYQVVQAPGNSTALNIKMKMDTHGEESNPVMWGAWGPTRNNLLGIRYLYVEGTTGIDRWEDTPSEEAVKTTLRHKGKKEYAF